MPQEPHLVASAGAASAALRSSRTRRRRSASGSDTGKFNVHQAALPRIPSSSSATASIESCRSAAPSGLGPAEGSVDPAELEEPLRLAPFAEACAAVAGCASAACAELEEVTGCAAAASKGSACEDVAETLCTAAACGETAAEALQLLARPLPRFASGSASDGSLAHATKLAGRRGRL